MRVCPKQGLNLSLRRYGCVMEYLAILHTDQRHLLVHKTLSNCVEQESMYFVICPKQGPKLEGVVLHRVVLFN